MNEQLELSCDVPESDLRRLAEIEAGKVEDRTADYYRWFGPHGHGTHRPPWWPEDAGR